MYNFFNIFDLRIKIKITNNDKFDNELHDVKNELSKAIVNTLMNNK